MNIGFWVCAASSIVFLLLALLFTLLKGKAASNQRLQHHAEGAAQALRHQMDEQRSPEHVPDLDGYFGSWGAFIPPHIHIYGNSGFHRLDHYVLQGRTSG